MAADRRVIITGAQACDPPKLAAALRAADLAEIAVAGIDAETAVRGSIRASVFAYTAWVGDDIAACFGVEKIDAGEASPWLLTTPAVERIPLQMVRSARFFVNRWLETWPVLRNRVDARYTQACRFLQLLGFHLHSPHDVGGVQFLVFERRRS